MVFRKGFVSNPGGSKQRRILSDALMCRLLWDADYVPRKSELRTAAHLVIEKMVQKALQGDMKAISLIYERLEGKAIQTIKDETERAPMDIMEAARRLAFALNSAALLGQPVDAKFTEVLPRIGIDAPKIEE